MYFCGQNIPRKGIYINKINIKLFLLFLKVKRITFDVNLRFSIKSNLHIFLCNI